MGKKGRVPMKRLICAIVGHRWATTERTDYAWAIVTCGRCAARENRPINPANWPEWPEQDEPATGL